MKLDQDQIDRFHKEGYLFLPQAFSADEVGVLRRRADAIFRLDREEVWRETSGVARTAFAAHTRSEEHTSELQSLMRISYAVFCLKKNNDAQNISTRECLTSLATTIPRLTST